MEKLNCESLMIGDWILFSGEPKRVKSIVISDNGVERIYVFGSTCQVSTIEAYIQPIPLTPEILEKNGFHINGMPNSITSVKAIDDWSDDTYVWSRQETPNERMFVSVYIDDPFNFFVEISCQYCHADGIHIRYIHELQNALKLCGIEKEIML